MPFFKAASGPCPLVVESLKEYDSARELRSSFTKEDAKPALKSAHDGPDPQVIASLKEYDTSRDELRGSFNSTDGRKDNKNRRRPEPNDRKGNELCSSGCSSMEDENIARLLKLEEKMDDLDQQIFRTQEMVRVRLDSNYELGAILSMKHCVKLEAQREQVLRKLQQTTSTSLPGSEFSGSSTGIDTIIRDDDDHHQSYTDDEILEMAYKSAIWQ